MGRTHWRGWLLGVPLMLLLACHPRIVEREIPLWHALGGPLGETLREIIRRFNAEEHPEVPIRDVLMGNYATLSQKLMAAVSAGQPPRLAQVYESWVGELREAGKLDPIGEDFLPDSVLQDIFPVFLKANRWGDTLITFPFNKSVHVLYYNRDLFDSLGLTPPTTWEAFRDVARRLTVDANGDGIPERYGTAFPVDVWLFTILLYQNGGRIYDGDRVAVADPPGVKALQFLVDLIHKDHVAYLASGYRHQDDFALGKVGMVFGTIVSYQFLKDKLTFRLGVAPLPVSGRKVIVMAGTNLALFQGGDSRERDVVYRFLRFFLRPEIQAAWVRGTGYLPLRRSVLDAPELASFFEEVPGMKEAILQVDYAVTEPRRAVWFTGRRYLSTEGLEPALRGVLSPEQALRRAARILQNDLDRRRTLEQRARP